jgi:hypothetical protein
MSSTAADETIVATLRRMNAETEKFVAEHDKLFAEAKKLNQDAKYGPILLIVAASGSVLSTVISLVALFLHTGAHG